MEHATKKIIELENILKKVLDTLPQIGGSDLGLAIRKELEEEIKRFV